MTIFDDVHSYILYTHLHYQDKTNRFSSSFVETSHENNWGRVRSLFKRWTSHSLYRVLEIKQRWQTPIFLFWLFSLHLSCAFLFVGFGFRTRRRSLGVTEQLSENMAELKITGETKYAILE